MTNPGSRIGWMALAAALMLVSPAAAQDDTPPEVSAAITQLVDDWYVEHCAGEDGRPMRYLAPGAIDDSPGFTFVDNGSAALGPQVFTSLAATMPLFRYEITRIRADARFARVHVRERGFRYASAAGRTYERRGDAMLVLERREDGRWLVLAHRSHSVGFAPSQSTVPMPDLSPLPDGGERPLPGPRCARLAPGEMGLGDAVSPSG